MRLQGGGRDKVTNEGHVQTPSHSRSSWSVRTAAVCRVGQGPSGPEYSSQHNGQLPLAETSSFIPTLPTRKLRSRGVCDLPGHLGLPLAQQVAGTGPPVPWVSEVLVPPSPVLCAFSPSAGRLAVLMLSSLLGLIFSATWALVSSHRANVIRPLTQAQITPVI